MSSKGKSLSVEKKQPISKENFEVIKKDQGLQQVVELKLEVTTSQKFDEEVKDKKVELIVEDPTEVKYKDESVTHNPQVLVDLLKMTTQYVNFLGVENFNLIINLLLIDVSNKLKVDEKKFYATLHEFKVFVYLEQKISDFDHQLKDKFVSSEGV